MRTQSFPTPTLPDLLAAILVIATRMLRDIHRHVTPASILKTILGGHVAVGRIGRAIRLTTLLIRRIQIHGLLPFPPARPRPTPATSRDPRPQTTPPLHTGNGDAAFVRRPIPTIVAAITRELHLAAQAIGLPLPESLQTLCFHAAIAAAPFEADDTQTQTPNPTQTPTRQTPTRPTAIWNQPPEPTPTKTLEL